MTAICAPFSSYPECLVCGEPADSIHFGAVSCRACAAFFRRKVAAGRLIKKYCNGSCPLDDHIIRRFCAFCRFEKCQKVGMNPSYVLSKQTIHAPSTSKSTLLRSFKQFYEKLIESRRIAYWREEGTTPKLFNYKDLRDEHIVDKKLIYDNFLPFFQSQAPMIEDQQQILDAHFIVPFVLLERAFQSQSGEHFVMASGSVIDINDLMMFYRNPEESDDGKAKDAKSVLEPYWKLNNQVLRKHLRELQLDVAEFLFLAAIIYWDFGLPDQSDTSIQICMSMRSKIVQHLTTFEKEHRRNGDHSLRVAEVMMVLQTVQKSINQMHECREISLVYDLQARACPLFDSFKDE